MRASNLGIEQENQVELLMKWMGADKSMLHGNTVLK